MAPSEGLGISEYRLLLIPVPEIDEVDQHTEGRNT